MPLTPGTRIGAYDVTGPLGAGAMGEVYRARDTKLDRDVALKVLPAAFTADPDRLARFEREARVLASLNHPNIAQIHGLEETGGTRALVLELVEGTTLAERLEQGPIPLDEVLSIARQIALALQAAHEAGVIHRDLKPANIKVREDGTVKVLDFGLAKALESAPAPTPDADPLQSPTLTASVTRMGGGLILGTPAYMSPEQAEAQPTDTRGDLWSFGVVLYEMFTGERLFAGETVAQVLARVIDRDLDLSALPPSTPPPVRRLLGRCLERDRRRRMRDAGEAISDLEAAAAPVEAVPEDAAGASTPPSALHRWRARIAWAVAGLILGCLAATATFRTLAPTSDPPAVRRLSLDLLTPTARGAGFALSPDGSILVYVGRSGRDRRLVMRRLDQAGAQPLAGTEGAMDPFFSPDGEWIGFFTGTGLPVLSQRVQPRWTLRKTPARGGAPVTLAENVSAQGGSWGDDDRIVIGGVGGLLRVPAAGGTPEAVLATGAVEALAVCTDPHVLPGSQGLLFTEVSTDGMQLKAASLVTAEQRTVAPWATAATYTPTGHLLFRQAARQELGGVGWPGTRAKTLMAVPFDADRLELTGAPVSVIPDVGSIAWSADGALLYTPAPDEGAAEARRTLVWLDRNGREEPIPAPPRAYGTPRVSPSGDHIALAVATDVADEILIYDLVRDVSNTLTFDAPWNSSPLWSPDGRRVVFTSVRDEGYGLFRKAADGTGQAERLTASPFLQIASTWAGDPDTLVVTHTDNITNMADVHLLSLAGGRASAPLIATASVEAHPAVSPDGRWIAYQSNEAGRRAVYVRPFPNVDDGRWQVSQGEGFAPAWSPRGRELFYIGAGPDGRAMMAVEYAGDPTFTPSRPNRLFATPRDIDLGGLFRQWDIAPDGQRFLMLKDADESGFDPGPGMPRGAPSRNDPRRGPRDLVYVGNWFTELAERVPTP